MSETQSIHPELHDAELAALRRDAELVRAAAVPVARVLCEILHDLGEVPQRVNAILDAERDPLGVASWWVSSNGRLPGAATPRELLGTPDERLLLALAQGVLD